MIDEEEYSDIAKDNERLRARIAELEAALKPFTDISCVLEETDSGTIYEWALDCDAIRAARAALEKKND